MSNTTLTADVIASEALVILENELGFLDTIHRMPPPKAVCRDFLIGFKSMPYVMRYSDFPY